MHTHLSPLIQGVTGHGPLHLANFPECSTLPQKKPLDQQKSTESNFTKTVPNEVFLLPESSIKYCM